MAVLEGVPGVKVTIRVNNVDCVEYDDPEPPEHPAQPTSSKYIESSDNAKFVIRFEVNHSYRWGYRKHVLCFRCYVDGKFVRGAVQRQNDAMLWRDIQGKDEFSTSTGSWVIRKLQFAAVKIIDDATNERIKKDTEASKEVGLIKVEVWRAIDLGSAPLSHNHEEATSLEFAEKSLKGKAISHGFTYSANTEPTVTPRYANTQNLLEDGGPLAVFRFQYRSRKALRDELILQATPPHSPTLDGLSEAELRRLARERLEQIDKKNSVKKESTPTIKREFGEVFDLTQDDSPGRPSKIPRPSEVIDLTDD